MHIESVHRWQWIAIGLLVGLLCGWLREANTNFADELATYGRRIGQADFERGIVRYFHSRAQFSNIVIHPCRLSGSSAGAVRVDVIEGLYWDGQTHEENGRLAARWEPAYFVASVPYRPATNAAGSASTPAKSQAVSAASFPDVKAYLASLPKSVGVQFRYDSWWWLTRPLSLYTLVGVVLLGLIWPTIINLLAFGSIHRPREARGATLLGIKGTTSAAPQKPVATSIETQWPDNELEQSLAEPSATNGAEPQPSVRTLSTGPATLVVPTAAEAQKAQKEFGANAGDFYPTERSGHRTLHE